jgi:hypothetical protein
MMEEIFAIIRIAFYAGVALLAAHKRMWFAWFALVAALATNMVLLSALGKNQWVFELLRTFAAVLLGYACIRRK